MKSNIRSAGGGLLMLMIVPAIVGLLACMPVPIGDPERSRIDSEITGVWVWLGGDEQAFYAFEPYDKRTWLLTGVPIEEGDEADFGDYELESYAELTRLIENETVGDDGATATEVVMYKVWRTKLGGEWFMTWEPKGLFDEGDFEPEVWFAFRIDRPDESTLHLYMIEDKLFKDVEETRRAYERVIRKNVKNEALYSDEPLRFIRVKPEHLSFFDDLASEVVAFD
jgi:hypothetical protein